MKKSALALLFLAACTSQPQPNTPGPWTRWQSNNGCTIDWRGNTSWIDVQNPMATRLHIYGVASHDDYADAPAYIGPDQAGAFDLTIDPHELVSIPATGSTTGANYHLTIQVEPAKR